MKIRTLTLPDRFIAHATPEEMYAEAELVKDKIVEKVLDTLNIKVDYPIMKVFKSCLENNVITKL